MIRRFPKWFPNFFGNGGMRKFGKLGPRFPYQIRRACLRALQKGIDDHGKEE